MNHQIPSVEDFLAQPDPAEDDLEPSVSFQGKPLTVGPGELWQLPPTDITGYVREINESLKAIAEATSGSTRLAEGYSLAGGLSKRIGQAVSEGIEGYGTGDALPAYDGTQKIDLSEYDDLYAKHQTLTQVISDVEAALGKSKAAPALAAKAVIDAWRNPQVPPAENQNEVDAALAAEEDREADEISAEAGYYEGDTAEVNESIPGHTRTPHPEGPDFCRECSGEMQEWVGWPCPTVTQAFNPLGAPVETEPVVIEPEKPQQPEHNAPVEEWREYARTLGYAGPEIDKANRSVIRTTLGIAQPGTD